MDKEAIKVLEVKRRNGQVLKAKIMAGPFDISFGLAKGKVRPISIIRLDKDRTESQSDLRVPDGLFNEARRRARGIFYSSRAKA